MSELPPDLAALYAAERAAAGPSPADRARIVGAVLATVGVAAAAGGATTASAAGSVGGKLVIALLVLGAAGGTAALVSRRATAEPAAMPALVVGAEPANLAIDVGSRAVASEVAPPVVASPVAASPVVSSRIGASPVVASPAAASPAAASPAVVAAEPPAQVVATPEGAESDAHRLVRAWALVEHGDAAGALDLVEGVSSGSALAEERAAVRAIALARVGRTADACTAAAAFGAAFPASVHRALVAKEAPCGSSL